MNNVVSDFYCANEVVTERECGRLQVAGCSLVAGCIQHALG